jgi:uncharacterized protein (TIGR02001 family)
VLFGLLVWPVSEILVASDWALTPTLTSDYDFRGVTQTANGSALQIAIDYTRAHAHLQCWTSNVTYDAHERFYGAAHTEVAWTADVPLGPVEGWHSDLGVTLATYPGLTPYSDYPEGFVTLAHGAYSLSYHYTWDYDHLPARLGAYYIEVNAASPLGHLGLELIAHLGRNGGPFWNAANGKAYWDYSLGVMRPVGVLDVSLRLVGTREYLTVPRGEPLSGETRWVIAVSTVLPVKKP